MDLNSLPEEMRAKVLKRADHPTAVRLRKMDSRMNAIAKKYDEGIRLPVSGLSCSFGQNYFQAHCCLSLYVDREIFQFLNPEKRQWEHTFEPYKFRFNIPQSSEQLECILSKIQVKKSLDLSGLPSKDNIIPSLYKHRRCLRDISALSTMVADSTSYKEVMPKLIDSCRILRDVGYFGVGSTLEAFCREEVLGSRQWNNIYIRDDNYGKLAQLWMNKSFLRSVVKNCPDFSFDGLPQFDVSDFLDFLEDCIKENKLSTVRSWYFGRVSPGHSTKSEIIRRLESVDKIKYTQFDPSAWTIYEITPDENPKTKIAFAVRQ